MLDCQLFGLNAPAHHLMSLFFHVANTLLLFLVLKKMTGAVWPSTFVAAAFALHPLHVESVAWISERKDVLSGFFFMLTMWAYVRYAERPNIARYLLIILAFCFGLLSKPMLVTLPFVLLLLDYWPLGRFDESAEWPVFYRLVREKVPFFVLSIISSAITFLAQRIAVTSMEELPASARIANAFISYIRYTGKMFWPSRLTIFYPHHGEKVLMWQVVISALLLLAVSVCVIRLARRHKYLPVGWLWYLGTLVPVIGLVQVGAQAMADRYTYLPSIGIFIMVAWSAAELAARWRFLRMWLGISMVLVLAILLVCARMQVRHWQNSTTLYGHAMAVVPNNRWAHNAFGEFLVSQGRFDEAVAQFTESLRIDPNNVDTKNELGKALLQQGKVEEAAELYQQFLPVLPDDINAPDVVAPAVARYGKLAEVVRVYTEAHANLGKALLQQGKVDEAIRHYEEVRRFRPEFIDTYKELGSTLLQQGKLEEAIRVYQKVLQILPDDPDAYGGLGIALGQQGKLDEAITYFTKALAIEPTFAEVHSNLGYALLLKGRLDEAVTHFERALQLKPNLADARRSLGDLFAQQGRFDEAVREYRKLLRITPDDPIVLNALGVALGRQGKLDEAIECFNEALRIKPDFAEALSNLSHAQALRGGLDKVK
jgi:protein O-mannosyl-transferase